MKNAFNTNLAAAVLSACLLGPPLFPDTRVTEDFCDSGRNDPIFLQVVLDRSGSMEAGRAASQRTRCEDSLLETKVRASSFLKGCPAGSQISVVTFFADSEDNAILNTLVDFTSDHQIVHAALDQAPPCDGGTPLADAICAGVERLDAFNQINPDQRYLMIVTDGGENLSTGPCSGPSTANPLPPYTPGSWPANVYTEIQNSTWLSSYYRLFCLPSEPPGSEVTFFQEFAAATGGTAQSVCDEGPRARSLFGIFTSDFETGTTEDWSGLMPGPDFVWSPQFPTPNEPVLFTTDSPGPWNWIFPGGLPMFSTERSPQVSFTFFGEKAVSLTTTNRRQKVVTVTFE